MVRSRGGGLGAVIGHRMPRSFELWAHQFAQAAAVREGSVLVAQLTDERCDLRMFAHESGDEAGGELAGTGSSSGETRVGDCDPLTFFKSMREAENPVGRWLLTVDGPSVAAAAGILGMIDHWTIITAVDANTCVGLYALVKELRKNEKFRLFREVDVFTVGGDQREASKCVVNANLLTQSLLRTPLVHAGHLRRAQKARASILGGFDLTPRQWPVVIDRLKRLSTRQVGMGGPALRLVNSCQ